MEKDKKNILWINYLKAISIIGVYLVHSQLYYGYMIDSINIFVHPFYVNAFFFISGYLLFRKQLSGNGNPKHLAENIIFKIMIPSIIFSAIEFLPSFLLRGKSLNLELFLIKTVGGCTYWFTSALVVAQLIIALLSLTRIKNIWFYFVSCCALFAIGSYLTYILPPADVTMSFPWQYRHGLYCIVFLAFGGLYYQYESGIKHFLNRYTVIVPFIIYTGCLLLRSNSFDVLVSMLDVNVPGILISILGTLTLIEICKLLPKIAILDYIGKNTLGIYFMSGALPTVLGMIMHHVFQKNNITGLIVVFLSSTIIAVFATYILNRFLPWIFDIRQIKTHNSKRQTVETSHVSHV